MPPRLRIAAWFAFGLLFVLSVVRSAGASQSGAERLSLEARPHPEGIEVAASLTDAQGRPISDAEIAFRRQTSFGWLEVARRTTAADGSARVLLPARGGPRVSVKAVAAFEDHSITKIVQLEPGGVRLPRIRPGEAQLGELSPQPGFISPYPPIRLILALVPVLAGVWATYVVVVYQLYGIARNI